MSTLNAILSSECVEYYIPHKALVGFFSSLPFLIILSQQAKTKPNHNPTFSPSPPLYKHNLTMKSTVAFLLALIALFSISAEASARSHSRSRAARTSTDSTTRTKLTSDETFSTILDQLNIAVITPSKSHSRSRTHRRKQLSAEPTKYENVDPSAGDGDVQLAPHSHSRSRSPRVNAHLLAKNVSHLSFDDGPSEIFTLQTPQTATSYSSSFVTPRRKLSMV